MKLKIIFSIIIAALMFNNASAITLIVGGCTKTLKYSVVTIDNNRNIVCLGLGSLDCPSSSIGVEGVSKIIYSLDDIVCLCTDKVAKKELSGTGLYNNDLPYSWKVLKNNAVQIEVNEVAIHKN